MRRSGIFELHAAGVVEPTGGVGALFIGNANSGKSTLTTRLADEGWGYLSDDILLLIENRGEIEARGLRRNFAISPLIGGGWKLPRLAEALMGPVPSDSTKRYFDPSIVFPNNFVESSVPKALFFSSITGEARSRVEQLSQNEAMMKLIGSCPWALYDKVSGREYLQVLASLVRQSCCWALYGGRDLLEEPDCAATLLSQHILN